MRFRLFICISIIAIAASCKGGDPDVRVKPPTLGWSSWNACLLDITDSLICAQADAMVSTGLAAAGYDHINIDDGFFGPRDAGGGMTARPDRFPRGMAPVADYIHSCGLKAGIYSDAGGSTCANLNRGDFYGAGAGLLGHDAQDIDRYFNEWGFDFIKIDFCGGLGPKLDPETRYRRIREVIDSVATKDVEFNLCRWYFPGAWAAEVADSWRIAPDLYVTWKSICEAMQRNMYLSAYAGGGHYNDMDMMIVGYGNKPAAQRGEGCLPFGEEQAHFGLWCIMSSPILLGCDLNFIPRETLDLVTNPELLAINQDPLGLQAHVVRHDGGSYVLAKDILKARGPFRAVALYNPADTSATVSFEPADIGFCGKVALRDLMERKDLGRFAEVSMQLPPHSAKILSVQGRRLDQKVYEAEWGFLPAYNDISPEGAKYTEMEGLHCRAGVIRLGGAQTNRLEWRDVYVRRAGSYKCTLRYTSRQDCDVFVRSGDSRIELHLPHSDSGEVKFNLSLHKGRNLIVLGNDTELIPAVIDCISI